MTVPAIVTNTANNAQSGSKKSNTGAIVGGVVGGVGGALVIAGIVGFLLWRRKKSKAVAFDDKMFEPDLQTHHSAGDEFLAAAGPAGTHDNDLGTVDPYPYEHKYDNGYQTGYDQTGYDHQGAYDQNGYEHAAGYEQAGYEHGAGYDQTGYENSYAQGGYDHTYAQDGSMAMPDARNYQPYDPSYPTYAAGGGGAAAGGAAAAAYAAHEYADDQSGAAAKAQEAYVDRSSNTSAATRYDDALSNQDHADVVYDSHAEHQTEMPPK
jgi:hypothetical protein